MTTTHELTLDLQKRGELQRIDVVQGDAGTRLVVLTLVSAVAVIFIFYFKLEKINMAEALKSVE